MWLGVERMYHTIFKAEKPKIDEVRFNQGHDHTWWMYEKGFSDRRNETKIIFFAHIKSVWNVLGFRVFHSCQARIYINILFIKYGGKDSADHMVTIACYVIEGDECIGLFMGVEEKKGGPRMREALWNVVTVGVLVSKGDIQWWCHWITHWYGMIPLNELLMIRYQCLKWFDTRSNIISSARSQGFRGEGY